MVEIKKKVTVIGNLPIILSHFRSPLNPILILGLSSNLLCFAWQQMERLFTIVVRNTKVGADYIGLNVCFYICRFVILSVSLKLYASVFSTEQ